MMARVLAVLAVLVVVAATATTVVVQARTTTNPPRRPGDADGTVWEGAFVHLFEWSWADVAQECEDWLGPKGFRAIQVSPPQEAIVGDQWWTRYQPVSYTLTSRSGTQEELQDAIDRCAAVGVDIIVDAVLNHGAAGSGVGEAGSPYGGRSYVMYSPDDLHHLDGNENVNCQVSDYHDKDNVQLCDLSGLPDLATENTYTQETLAAYLDSLSSMGVTGFRLDAAKHQDAGDLASALSRTTVGNPWYFSEVIDSDPTEAVSADMYYDIGAVTEFNYADWLDPNIISEGKMVYLENFGEDWGLMPDEYALVFLENHDTERNGEAQLTYKNGTLYKFATIFALSWPYGNLKIMSSYYFSYDNTDQGPPAVPVHDGSTLNCMDGVNWVCQHRWTAIANMVAWRNSAGTAGVDNWQQGNDNQIAYSRNSAAFIALNRDEGNEWNTVLQTGLTAGDYCNVIVSDDPKTCSVVTVNNDGTASLSVPTLSAVALHKGVMP